jgi:hypothetical protein
MTMKMETFERPDLLVAFVNDNALPAAQVAEIREYNGRWYLFYYE